MGIRFQKCSKCVIAFIGICSSVFVVGIVLLIIGFLNYMSEPAPPPYMWSLNVCQLTSEDGTPFLNKWVGYPLPANGECPSPLLVGTTQTFQVGTSILGESIPYSVAVYVTNKISGKFGLSHYIQGGIPVLGIVPIDLNSFEKTDFAYCGGKPMDIYRSAPLNEDDGDYITDTCTNEDTGCIYEPARSLTSYDLKLSTSGDVQTLHMKDITGGSYFDVTIELSIQQNATTNENKKFVPEVYVEYRVAGRGPQQDMGLILLIIGGVLADLMPATLYFLLQKYYYKNDSIEKLRNEDTTGIPLMDLDGNNSVN